MSAAAVGGYFQQVRVTFPSGVFDFSERVLRNVGTTFSQLSTQRAKRTQIVVYNLIILLSALMVTFYVCLCVCMKIAPSEAVCERH